MTVAVYCSRPSESASLLVKALRRQGMNARRVRRLDRLRDDDFVVNWGQRGLEALPYAGLNHRVPANKYEELLLLAEHDIPVPAHSLFAMEDFRGRTYHHSQGRDFLDPPSRFDYYVEWLDIAEEWRFHTAVDSEGPKVIRRARKVLRESTGDAGEGRGGVIRAHAAGWVFSYAVDPEPPTGARALAKQALASTGCQFGAVDIAVTTGGRLVVLEFNSAPGFDAAGSTVDRYAAAIAAHAAAY